MRVIDAQIHIWAASRPDRPWPNDRAAHVHGPASVTIEQVLAEMDAAGVDGAILIPPSFEGDRNDLVLDAVNRFPDRFRALARFALDRPEARAQVAALAGRNRPPRLRPPDRQCRRGDRGEKRTPEKLALVHDRSLPLPF